jgi:hypothetical protein
LIASSSPRSSSCSASPPASLNRGLHPDICSDECNEVLPDDQVTDTRFRSFVRNLNPNDGATRACFQSLVQVRGTSCHPRGEFLNNRHREPSVVAPPTDYAVASSVLHLAPPYSSLIGLTSGRARGIIPGNRPSTKTTRFPLLRSSANRHQYRPATPGSGHNHPFSEAHRTRCFSRAFSKTLPGRVPPTSSPSLPYHFLCEGFPPPSLPAEHVVT